MRVRFYTPSRWDRVSCLRFFYIRYKRYTTRRFGGIIWRSRFHFPGRVRSEPLGLSLSTIPDSTQLTTLKKIKKTTNKRTHDYPSLGGILGARISPRGFMFSLKNPVSNHFIEKFKFPHWRKVSLFFPFSQKICESSSLRKKLK